MSESCESVLGDHPKFFEYERFFRASANPQCHNCHNLANFTTYSALNVIKKAAVLNRRQTKVKRIVASIEEAVLLAEQQVFLAAVSHCLGEIILDRDVESAELDIRRTGVIIGSNPESIEERVSKLLPLTEECGLIPLDRNT